MRNKSHAVLTEDCLNVQACYATRFARFIGKAATGHVLVVPHHGGKFRKQKPFNYFRLSGSSYPRKAIVSVGNSNIYNHPDKITMGFFNAVMNNSVDCTNQKGSLKESLSESVL